MVGESSLEEDGAEWNDNAAERALRSGVVIRKITWENQSDDGATAHAVLMSVGEMCNLRKGRRTSSTTRWAT